MLLLADRLLNPVPPPHVALTYLTPDLIRVNRPFGASRMPVCRGDKGPSFNRQPAARRCHLLLSDALRVGTGGVDPRSDHRMIDGSGDQALSVLAVGPWARYRQPAETSEPSPAVQSSRLKWRRNGSRSHAFSREQVHAGRPGLVFGAHRFRRQPGVPFVESPRTIQ